MKTLLKTCRISSLTPTGLPEAYRLLDGFSHGHGRRIDNGCFRSLICVECNRLRIRVWVLVADAQVRLVSVDCVDAELLNNCPARIPSSCGLLCLPSIHSYISYRRPTKLQQRPMAPETVAQRANQQDHPGDVITGVSRYGVVESGRDPGIAGNTLLSIVQYRVPVK